MKHKTLMLAVAGIAIFAYLMFAASYNSLDSQIARNGFVLNYSGPTTPFYHESVLRLPAVNLTSINTLQLYAHNMGVKTIYSYTNHVTDWAGTQYYYFLTSNNTLYYAQFDIVTEKPFPLLSMVPAIVCIVIGAAVIAGVLTFYSYRKLQTSTQESKEVQK